jgi:hypothetical protein
MPKKNANSNLKMMGGKSSKSSDAPTGYTSKKSPASSSGSSASRVGSRAENEVEAEPIGCHEGNVYEDGYVIDRIYPGCIVGSFDEFAQLSAQKVIPSWIFRRESAIQYRESGGSRGGERHGNPKKALIKEVRLDFVKNDFPAHLLLTSNALQGRAYTDDGKRGITSVPSQSLLQYPKGKVVHLSTSVDNKFLRYAGVEAKKILGEKLVEHRANENGVLGERYVVPMDSIVGQVVKDHTVLSDKKNREGLYSAGVGSKYKVQVHAVIPDHWDLSPAQFTKAVAVLVAESNRGPTVDMSCLDIGIIPVSGTWGDNSGLEEWTCNQRSLATVRQTPFSVQFQLNIKYRLFGHPDMVKQKS